METAKLRQALDEIIERCKAAGHRLHIFDPADIKYENVVGRGEEGIVQLCRVNYHGLEELSAIKTITSNGDKEMLEFLLQELELVVLGSDALANAVLKVFGVALIPVNLNTRSHHAAVCHLGIVMERGLCNLLQLCQREEMNLYLRVNLMHQLARAIHHLHSGDPHIIHRDIKPQNIVVTEAERSEKTGLLKNVKVKLIDLGMACRVRHLEEKVSSVVGTEGFHAPEMWDEKPYTSKADIFSLGVTFIIVLMHQDSLRNINEILETLHEAKVKGVLGKKMYDLVKENVIPDSEIPEELENLLYGMTSAPKQRIADVGKVFNELTKIMDDIRPLYPTSTPLPAIAFQGGFRYPQASSRKSARGRGSGSGRGIFSGGGFGGGGGGGNRSQRGMGNLGSSGRGSDYSSWDSGHDSKGSKRSGVSNDGGALPTTPVTPTGSVVDSSNKTSPGSSNKAQGGRVTRSRSMTNKAVERRNSTASASNAASTVASTSAAASGAKLSARSTAQTPSSRGATPTSARSRGITPVNSGRSTPTSGSLSGSQLSEDFNELAKELESKESIISLKEQLLLEKERRLLEQQKNLKKLEQQNKLLREQLAASKKKDGASAKGVRGGRKPRNLFPDAALIEPEPEAGDKVDYGASVTSAEASTSTSIAASTSAVSDLSVESTPSTTPEVPTKRRRNPRNIPKGSVTKGILKTTESAYIPREAYPEVLPGDSKDVDVVGSSESKEAISEPTEEGSTTIASEASADVKEPDAADEVFAESAPVAPVQESGSTVEGEEGESGALGSGGESPKSPKEGGKNASRKRRPRFVPQDENSSEALDEARLNAVDNSSKAVAKSGNPRPQRKRVAVKPLVDIPSPESTSINAFDVPPPTKRTRRLSASSNASSSSTSSSGNAGGKLTRRSVRHAVPSAADSSKKVETEKDRKAEDASQSALPGTGEIGQPDDTVVSSGEVQEEGIVAVNSNTVIPSSGSTPEIPATQKSEEGIHKSDLNVPVTMPAVVAPSEKKGVKTKKQSKTVESSDVKLSTTKTTSTAKTTSASKMTSTPKTTSTTTMESKAEEPLLVVPSSLSETAKESKNDDEDSEDEDIPLSILSSKESVKMAIEAAKNRERKLSQSTRHTDEEESRSLPVKGGDSEIGAVSTRSVSDATEVLSSNDGQSAICKEVDSSSTKASRRKTKLPRRLVDGPSSEQDVVDGKPSLENICNKLKTDFATGPLSHENAAEFRLELSAQPVARLDKEVAPSKGSAHVSKASANPSISTSEKEVGVNCREKLPPKGILIRKEDTSVPTVGSASTLAFCSGAATDVVASPLKSVVERKEHVDPLLQVKAEQFLAANASRDPRLARHSKSQPPSTLSLPVVNVSTAEDKQPSSRYPDALHHNRNVASHEGKEKPGDSTSSTPAHTKPQLALKGKTPKGVELPESVLAKISAAATSPLNPVAFPPPPHPIPSSSSSSEMHMQSKLPFLASALHLNDPKSYPFPISIPHHEAINPSAIHLCARTKPDLHGSRDGSSVTVATAATKTSMTTNLPYLPSMGPPKIDIPSLNANLNSAPVSAVSPVPKYVNPSPAAPSPGLSPTLNSRNNIEHQQKLSQTMRHPQHQPSKHHPNQPPRPKSKEQPQCHPPLGLHHLQQQPIISHYQNSDISVQQQEPVGRIAKQARVPGEHKEFNATNCDNANERKNSSPASSHVPTNVDDVIDLSVKTKRSCPAEIPVERSASPSLIANQTTKKLKPVDHRHSSKERLPDEAPQSLDIGRSSSHTGHRPRECTNPPVASTPLHAGATAPSAVRSNDAKSNKLAPPDCRADAFQGKSNQKSDILSSSRKKSPSPGLTQPPPPAPHREKVSAGRAASPSVDAPTRATNPRLVSPAASVPPIPDFSQLPLNPQILLEIIKKQPHMAPLLVTQFAPLLAQHPFAAGVPLPKQDEGTKQQPDTHQHVPRHHPSQKSTGGPSTASVPLPERHLIPSNIPTSFLQQIVSESQESSNRIAGLMTKDLSSGGPKIPSAPSVSNASNAPAREKSESVVSASSKSNLSQTDGDNFTPNTETASVNFQQPQRVASVIQHANAPQQKNLPLLNPAKQSQSVNHPQQAQFHPHQLTLPQPSQLEHHPQQKAPSKPIHQPQKETESHSRLQPKPMIQSQPRQPPVPSQSLQQPHSRLVEPAPHERRPEKSDLKIISDEVSPHPLVSATADIQFEELGRVEVPTVVNETALEMAERKSEIVSKTAPTDSKESFKAEQVEAPRVSESSLTLVAGRVEIPTEASESTSAISDEAAKEAKAKANKLPALSDWRASMLAIQARREQEEERESKFREEKEVGEVAANKRAAEEAGKRDREREEREKKEQREAKEAVKLQEKLEKEKKKREERELAEQRKKEVERQREIAKQEKERKKQEEKELRRLQKEKEKELKKVEEARRKKEEQERKEREDRERKELELKLEEQRRIELEEQKRKVEENRLREEELKKEEERSRREEEERIRREEELRIRREEELRIRREEEERIRREEERIQREQEEERIRREKEERIRREEEERIRREEERIRREGEEERIRREEDRRREEERLKVLEQQREEVRRREEEKRKEQERLLEEQRKEEERQRKMEEEWKRRIEEERLRKEEEKKRREEERRIKEEEKKRKAEEKRIKEEERRQREEEKRRREEERLRLEEERKEEERFKEAERLRIEEEKRRLEEEHRRYAEMVRLEEERRIEEERLREKQRRAEEERLIQTKQRLEDEERQRREELRKQEDDRLKAEEMAIKEEKKRKEEERRQREQQRRSQAETSHSVIVKKSDEGILEELRRQEQEELRRREEALRKPSDSHHHAHYSNRSRKRHKPEQDTLLVNANENVHKQEQNQQQHYLPQLHQQQQPLQEDDEGEPKHKKHKHNKHKKRSHEKKEHTDNPHEHSTFDEVLRSVNEMLSEEEGHTQITNTPLSQHQQSAEEQHRPSSRSSVKKSKVKSPRRDKSSEDESHERRYEGNLHHHQAVIPNSSITPHGNADLSNQHPRDSYHQRHQSDAHGQSTRAPSLHATDSSRDVRKEQSHHHHHKDRPRSHHHSSSKMSKEEAKLQKLIPVKKDGTPKRSDLPTFAQFYSEKLSATKPDKNSQTPCPSNASSGTSQQHVHASIKQQPSTSSLKSEKPSNSSTNPISSSLQPSQQQQSPPGVSPSHSSSSQSPHPHRHAASSQSATDAAASTLLTAQTVDGDRVYRRHREPSSGPVSPVYQSGGSVVSPNYNPIYHHLQSPMPHSPSSSSTTSSSSKNVDQTLDSPLPETATRETASSSSQKSSRHHFKGKATGHSSRAGALNVVSADTANTTSAVAAATVTAAAAAAAAATTGSAKFGSVGVFRPAQTVKPQKGLAGVTERDPDWLKEAAKRS